MSFASVAELAAYLQREAFAGAEITSAQLALDIATAVVVERTGQTFELVEDDEVTLDAHPGDDIFLPQRPVIAIASVTTRNPGSATTTSRGAYTDYEARGARLRWTGLGFWPAEVTVVYTHGYATLPNDVKGATLAVAAEIHSNPEGLASSALDDSNDRHEWADDSPAERMLKLVARKYGHNPLTVRLR